MLRAVDCNSILSHLTEQLRSFRILPLYAVQDGQVIQRSAPICLSDVAKTVQPAYRLAVTFFSFRKIAELLCNGPKM